MADYIFIDTSYMIFFKMHAVIAWSNHSKTELSEDMAYEKFGKSFCKEMGVIKKKYAKTETKIIFCVDDSRSNLWRKQLYDNYKGSRKNNSEVLTSQLFKYFYKNMLEAFSSIRVDTAEADDVIAVCKGQLKPFETCVIITSDDDFLQLYDERTTIVNLKYKLAHTRYTSDELEHFTMIKVICGDKSDNIPSITTKLGPKTSLRWALNPTLLESKLKDQKVLEQYNLNRSLIDFARIPLNIQGEIISKFKKLI